MNRLTYKMMSALLVMLMVVSACTSNAAAPTTTASTNPTATSPATSVPTQAAAPTTAPTAAPTSAPGPQPQVTTVVSQAQNAIDACTLVTKDEASQAIGAQVQDGLKNAKQYTAFAQGFGLGSATVSSCTYVGQGAGQYVNVFVFQFVGVATDVALQEFKTELSQNAKATEISGLGDLAYSLPATVIVLKGSTAFAVNVIASPQDLAVGKYDKAQALATVAVTRLP